MRCFLITIDVEDWFQVENLRRWNPSSAWGNRELRVEANVHRLLDLFDDIDLHESSSPAPTPGSTNLVASSISSRQTAAMKKVRCTFFILGWIAERLPHLVREIAARGHEVASHGSSHRICSGMPPKELKKELADSKRLIEDIAGTEVSGFRAPNFSVTDDVLRRAQECGYRYDSSYNSFALHGRYGKISLNGNSRSGIAHKLADDFFELPVSNLPFPTLNIFGVRIFKNFFLPWAGGAYFRLMPLSLFQRGVRSILARDGSYLFYMHPWEIDPGQPRVEQAGIRARFKHYTHLAEMLSKLRRLIDGFGACRFVTCKQYLEENNESI